jgi:hypothetical protein
MRPFAPLATPSPERTPLSPSPARVRSTIAAAVSQPEDLRQLRAFHKALADVNRLRIIRLLAGGDATVTELTDRIGLSQPLVSWHLGRLRGEAFAEFAARERAALGFAG